MNDFNRRKFIESLVMSGSLFSIVTCPILAQNNNRIKTNQGYKIIPVDYAISDHPVRFCLLTHETSQYVAFYNKDRIMTIGQRKLSEEKFTFKKLDSKIGPDTHNYITMAIDSNAHLHISGNMHCDPLNYWRTEEAGNIQSIKRIEKMTGQLEKKVTYPHFFFNKEGQLIFYYRDGGSGRGNNWFNKYDPATKTWAWLLNTPIFDGQKKCNAYMTTPFMGPDGWFHSYGVWRDTPDAATNRDLTYLKSKDLKTWYNAADNKISIPVYSGVQDVIVDPIPIRNGLINGGPKHAFDNQNKICLAYHKHDVNGHMQIYIARFISNKWQIVQITDWDKKVLFGGRGSLGFIGIKISVFIVNDQNQFKVSYSHKDYGAGNIYLNSDLKSISASQFVETSDTGPEIPKANRTFDKNNKFNNKSLMQINRAVDLGKTENGKQYFLQWETLKRNRDKWNPKPWPEPGMLYLVELN